ncbi:MAG: DUF2194 domain-containing protein [Clostridia bacterium]|nr:DUF2194 domain-containing protein [Clostridia bacterium]
MLKRSEYMVMSMSFLFMLAIFLVISINYITDSSASNNDFTDKFDATAHVADMTKLETEYIVITGDDQTIYPNVVNALNYAKKGNQVFYNVEEVPTTLLKEAKAAIVTTSNLSSISDMDSLMRYVNRGLNVFFAALPQEGSVQYDTYREALGIVSRTGDAQLEGFQAFEGMYAQGKVVCNDYPLEVENIRVDATCRKYIFQYSSDPGADQAEMVPLLWRTVYGDGQIYILNADFMEQAYSTGLCIGVLSCMESEYAYPIVDAKVNYIDSFPFLSYENGDSMMKFYSRDSQSFIRDQVWPSLVTMMKDTDIKFTGLYYAYITDAARKAQYSTDTLSYFKKQFSKYECEFGFGGYHPDVLSGKEFEEDAMNESYDQFKWNMANYNLVTYKYSNQITQSVQADMLQKLRNIRVYVCKLQSEDKDEYQAPLGFAEGSIVNMPIICEEITPSYPDYWKACNMASGMGLSTHSFDLYDVITNNANVNYEWMTYSQELSKQLNLLNRGTSWLTERTSAQAGYHAKRYLCLMPEITFTSNSLTIRCENFDDTASFIVKTERRLKPDDANYTAEEISDNFYLVKILKPEVTIDLIGTAGQSYLY